jgi:hypothetical protein
MFKLVEEEKLESKIPSLPLLLLSSRIKTSTLIFFFCTELQLVMLTPN